MRKTAIEFEPEFTANRSVPSGLTIRFWSESNGPRANVPSKTPIPPAGVLPRKVGFPLPSFLKVRMELPAVLLLSSQIISETPALQAEVRTAAAIVNAINKTNRRRRASRAALDTDANTAWYFLGSPFSIGLG